MKKSCMVILFYCLEFGVWRWVFFPFLSNVSLIALCVCSGRCVLVPVTQRPVPETLLRKRKLSCLLRRWFETRRRQQPTAAKEDVAFWWQVTQGPVPETLLQRGP